MIKNYYEEISSGYEELYGKEQRKKLFLIKKNSKINKKILDIGSGTGISAEFFKNVTCLEPSLKMLQQGLKKRTFFSINDCAENISNLFKEDEFDSIICVSTAHHFHDLEKVIQGIKKVCKQEGQIIFSLLKNSRLTPLITKE